MKFTITLLALIAVCSNALAWDGYDSQRNTTVSFSNENTFKEGQKVKMYDAKTRKEHLVVVESFKVIWGGSSEMTVYDTLLDMKRVLWME